IVLYSSFLSLNRKEELRPMTLRSLICARAAINSSERPSEKYSSFGSPLSFSSGNTAIDFCETADPALTASLGGVVVLLVRKRLKASRLAAITATATMNMANFLRLQVGRTASGGRFSVRFRPSGVASNAQEIITEM